MTKCGLEISIFGTNCLKVSPKFLRICNGMIPRPNLNVRLCGFVQIKMDHKNWAIQTLIFKSESDPFFLDMRNYLDFSNSDHIFYH